MKLVYTSAMFISSALRLNKTRIKPQIIEKKKDVVTGLNSIYEVVLKTINGREVSFEQYRGKKLLIVNTASKCGLAPQLEELQKLHELHGDKIVVLGVPSEDFGGQEYGEDSNIEQFCVRNYGVSFQMFSKSNVSGPNANNLFKWLSTKEANGWNDKAPNWNYCKYLINENGELEKCFTSTVSPLSTEITSSL